MAIYIARDLTGETWKKLGECLDGISGPGITARYNHISRELKRNTRLEARVGRVRKQIVNNQDASPVTPLTDVVSSPCY